MKAIVYENYGSPDVLQLKEVDKPIPTENEVLVKVCASSVNPLDWHNLRGKPVLQRAESGLIKPKKKILGADVAGRVEAVGRSVTRFKPGDEIFADLYWDGFGAFAEYVCVPEDATALKPAAVTFEQAAAAPQGAITALHALRDSGEVQPGQKVLVNGASGGVGTFVVQIAKAYGAEVTGVCSTRNLEMVRSIGADEVIDYTQQDFTQNGQRYDLIVDNVANHSIPDLGRVLIPGGRCVVVGFSTLFHLLNLTLLGPWISRTQGKQIGMLWPKKNDKDLMEVKELLEAGLITSVVDRCYPFSEVPHAIRYLEEGHARGKVVITMNPIRQNERSHGPMEYERKNSS